MLPCSLFTMTQSHEARCERTNRAPMHFPLALTHDTDGTVEACKVSVCSLDAEVECVNDMHSSKKPYEHNVQAFLVAN